MRRALCNEGLAVVQDAHPSSLHSQQHILTQHEMLPQRPVYRNELNYERFNITLARKNAAL